MDLAGEEGKTRENNEKRKDKMKNGIPQKTENSEKSVMTETSLLSAPK